MTTTPSLHAQIMALHVTHHAFGDRVSRHAAAELALAADAETERLTVELAREKLNDELCAENDTLKAELAALRSQEPVPDTAIRLLVAAGPISQEKVDEAFGIATPLAAPVPVAPLTLTDEQIIKIAETLGLDIPGESNYESWGQGYRKDESGAYRIPNAPRLCVPFARAILAAAMKEMK